MTLLAIGTMLNAFMTTPQTLQLALGRARLIIALNCAYALIFIPAAALLLAYCAAVSVSPVGRRMLAHGWSYLARSPA